MSYAKNTSVPVERSRAEVEKTLKRYGADQFTSGWTEAKAVVMFRMKGRYIRIEMPVPQLADLKTPTWKRVKGGMYSQELVDRENRRRWRAMILYVKAKLESVESQIVSFEEAFMAHIVLPNKQTVGQFMRPQIEHAYSDGKMPKLLDHSSGGSGGEV